MLKFILFLYILHMVFSKQDNYFCKFACRSEHTVCKRQPCSLSPVCGGGAKALPLNDNNRQWILDVHNKRRNALALGQDTTAGNSQAANMRALSYDKELEFVAQCWANACMEGGSAHDKCRSTSKFLQVGQNMFAVGSSGNQDFMDNKWLTQSVDTWYAEISLTNPSLINNYQGGQATGHFTQVVWAETTHIGCGRTYFKSKSGFFSVYIYCNYGAAGNILGTPVYVRGTPCSKCGPHSCNTLYRGLCGKVESLAADTWKSPFKLGGSRLQVSSFVFFIIFIMIYCQL